MDLLNFGLRPLSDFLSGPVRDEIRRRATRRRFGDRQALHMRGDGSTRLCLIVEGRVRIGRFQHDGAFTLLSMLGPGAHYGDVALQRRAFTQHIYAQGPTEIDMVDATTLEGLLRDHPALAVALWRCGTERLNAVLELYDDARTLDVTTRLAKVIYVHLGRGELVNGVACLQRDLAELLGVSKVAVGKAVRDLKGAGLIEAGYRQITVPSRSRLKAWLRRSGAT